MCEIISFFLKIVDILTEEARYIQQFDLNDRVLLDKDVHYLPQFLIEILC
ncbi:MAG: hypothetical protein ACMUEM_05645 [Flavobacteriales bacterium AspAUS03]